MNDKLKVVIDARMITPGKNHGIARYTFELIKFLGLLKQEENIEYIEYIVVISPESEKLKILEPLSKKNIRFVSSSLKWLSLKELFKFSSLLKELNADVFHSPSFMVPLFSPCPYVLTLHDLNHVDLSHLYSFKQKVYYKQILKPLAQKAGAIITVSEFSRKKLQSWLNRKDITTTLNGISNSYKIESYSQSELLAQKDQTRSLLSLPPKFLLGISHDKPHKNSNGAVKAYLHSQTELPFVLIGKRENIDPSLIEEANQKGKSLLFIPFAPENLLPFLYNLSELFIFPSSYEGFGLPALEALGMNIPSLVSSGTCFEEIFEQAAIYADPNSFEDIANKINSYLQNEDKKSKLLRARPSVLAKLDWLQLAEKTRDIYLNLGRSRSQ